MSKIIYNESAIKACLPRIQTVKRNISTAYGMLPTAQKMTYTLNHVGVYKKYSNIKNNSLVSDATRALSTFCQLNSLPNPENKIANNQLSDKGNEHIKALYKTVGGFSLGIWGAGSLTVPHIAFWLRILNSINNKFSSISNVNNTLENYSTSDLIQQKTNTSNTTSVERNRTLSINWNNINQIGKQAPKACMKYACAYARTIFTQELTDVSIFGDTYMCYWKNYFCKNTKTESTYFPYLYECVNSGIPVVIHVKGNGSDGHFVTVVGYTNVTDMSKFATNNFIIIDPADGKQKNLTDGSTGYSILDYNCYISNGK